MIDPAMPRTATSNVAEIPTTTSNIDVRPGCLRNSRRLNARMRSTIMAVSRPAGTSEPTRPSVRVITRSVDDAAATLCVTITTERPVLMRDVVEQRHDRGAGLRVEIARRLVGENQRRIHHQRPGDGDSLHLAAGQLRRSVLGSISEVHQGQQLQRAGFDLRHPGAVEQLRHRHVLPCRHRRQQVEELKDESDTAPSEFGLLVVVEVADLLTLESDRSGVWSVQRAEQVQQGALARAGRTDDGYELPAGQRQGDAVERADRLTADAVCLGDLRQLQHRVIVRVARSCGGPGPRCRWWRPSSRCSGI